MKRFWNICIYLLWPWFKIYRDWRKAYNGLVSEKCLEKENPYPDCLLSWLPAAEQACLLWSHWCLNTNKGLQQRDFRRCAFWCLFPCCLWFHAWRWGWGHELFCPWGSASSRHLQPSHRVYSELIWTCGKPEAHVHFFPVSPVSWGWHVFVSPAV